MARIGSISYSDKSREFTISVDWESEDKGIPFRVEIYAYAVVDKTQNQENWELVARIDDWKGAKSGFSMTTWPYDFKEAFPPKNFFEIHYKAELYKCIETKIGDPEII